MDAYALAGWIIILVCIISVLLPVFFFVRYLVRIRKSLQVVQEKVDKIFLHLSKDQKN